MEFRLITDEEYPEVVELLAAAFPEKSRDWIDGALDSEHMHEAVHGLFVEGQLVGTLTYGRIYSETWEGNGYIRFCAVYPEHQRQGLGTWMVTQALDDLKGQAGCDSVFLGILREDIVGQAFWKMFGFEGYGEDDAHLYYGLQFAKTGQ